MTKKTPVPPNDWYIVLTKENKYWIEKWHQEKNVRFYGSSYAIGTSYGLWKGNAYSLAQSTDAYKFFGSITPWQEITTAQFKEHILGFILSPTIEDWLDKESKIMGYKLIKKEYEKAANVICGGNFYSNENIIIEGTVPVDKLRAANVLDSWFEPIYEKESTEKNEKEKTYTYKEIINAIDDAPYFDVKELCLINRNRLIENLKKL